MDDLIRVENLVIKEADFLGGSGEFPKTLEVLNVQLVQVKDSAACCDTLVEDSLCRTLTILGLLLFLFLYLGQFLLVLLCYYLGHSLEQCRV